MQAKKRTAVHAVKAAGGKILKDLEELSLNLWWSWQPEARDLWSRVAQQLAPSLRAARPINPPSYVAALRPKHLHALASDASYVRLHTRVLRRLRSESRPRSRAPEGLSWKSPVAYFSMEFGVHESLPVYAGGLGILAGDHAKSASDENLPLVGVGLYYRRGYFTQHLDERGRQQVIQKPARTDRLPMVPVRTPAKRELRIAVELPQGRVQLRAWRLQVGRVPVFLLDSDVPENGAKDRKITQRLYSVAREERIQQEILCGVGGVRLLRLLGIRPAVWHLNEGHVAFLTLERLREIREQGNVTVEEALEKVAADTVFTTHTPVPEGNEVFDLALARRHLEPYTRAAGMVIDEYLSLGVDASPSGQPVLSMTVLALRLSRLRNGVSALHGEVSRNMWQHLWPGFRAAAVPIGAVTNGVHMPTWVAPEMDALFREHFGSDWTTHLNDPKYWKDAARLPDRKLWEVKQDLKRELVDFVREREDQRLQRFGWSAARRRRAAGGLLDPEALTLGFARRFALYKRADLLFRDLKRAARLFSSKKRPVQIVFAGKPHPEDSLGRKLFERISVLSRRPELRGKVALVENYDMEVGQKLVQGVDVWLNNPRRPLEASGTSGQKVPLNGGVNCSILDGWWCEGFSPQVGWAFGKPVDYADHEKQDRDDSDALYRVLERELVPLYYRRDAGGVPRAWLRMVKAAIADTAHRFSSSRMVLEYARDYYAPAARRAATLEARGGSLARELVGWKETVYRSWPLVHVRGARSGERGARGKLELEVFLAGIEPEAIACVDSRGEAHAVGSRAAGDCASHVLSVAGARAGETLWLYPTHASLAHPRELGLALEIAL